MDNNTTICILSFYIILMNIILVLKDTKIIGYFKKETNDKDDKEILDKFIGIETKIDESVEKNKSLLDKFVDNLVEGIYQAKGGQ